MINVCDKEIIIKNYISNYFNHHIISYNNFIQNGLSQIIDENNVAFINKNDKTLIKLEFSNPTITNPKIINDERELKILFPDEARKRNLNYDASLFVSIKEILLDENQKTIKEKYHHNIMIAKIPVMLKSYICNITNTDSTLECNYDLGGYFIIRGKERVLVSQIRNSYNTTIVVKENNFYLCEVRSISEINGHSVLVKIKGNNKSITLNFSYLKNEIPIILILNIFKIFNISDLSKYIKDEKILEFLENFFIENEEKDPIDYIFHSLKNENDKTKKIESVEQVIFNEMFPHIGIFGDIKEKIFFLCRMLTKLCNCILNITPEDSKDHLINKRYESSGTLLHDLFRQLFKKFLQSLDSNLFDINNISQNNFITKKIQSCFLTGNWGAQMGCYMRSGVSQILGRKNYWEYLSYLQRVAFPVMKETKNMDIRQIHSSQAMFICPFETPEGLNCGIVTNLTFLTTISIKYPTNLLRKKITQNKYYFPLTNYNVLIYLNYIPVGSTNNPELFVINFKKNRKFEYQEFFSINYEKNDNEILIFSDEGRLIRPIFNTKNLKNALNSQTFIPDLNFLFKNNILEMVDINELINSTSSFDDSMDYMEITSSSLLGIMAGLIPFSNHSPAPRNCYASAQGKQAISIYSRSLIERFDTVMYQMHYLQKPLIKTLTGKIFGIDAMPTGINCIVAIANYLGFNQEDAIVINKQSIERGLFDVSVVKCHQCEEKKTNTSIIFFKLPTIINRKIIYNYNHLDEHGIVKIGSYVEKNDVIVARTLVIIKKDGTQEQSDLSLVIGKNEEGIVEKINFSTNVDGNNQVKIIIRNLKKIEVGDKVASNGAQKSIVAFLADSWNMPFTSKGLIPDLIMSPLAFPSRATINQILSTVLGKIICEDPSYDNDASAFSHSHTPENLIQKLVELGYEKSTEETMYNGMTGEMIKSQIFIGPTYYQRLKHNVSEKIYARNRGPKNMMTRAPGAGRSNLGGIKMGNMEVDALLAHGAASELNTRLTKCCDEFYLFICNNCGHILNSFNNQLCNICKEGEIKKTILPYISKLIFQELNTMLIKTKISLSD